MAALRYEIKTRSDIGRCVARTLLDNRTPCSHPNLVRMVACITEEYKPAMIMEYCPDGDLLKYIRTRAERMIRVRICVLETHTSNNAHAAAREGCALCGSADKR